MTDVKTRLAMLVLTGALAAGCSPRTIQSAQQDTQHNLAATQQAANQATEQTRQALQQAGTQAQQAAEEARKRVRSKAEEAARTLKAQTQQATEKLQAQTDQAAQQLQSQANKAAQTLQSDANQATQGLQTEAERAKAAAGEAQGAVAHASVEDRVKVALSVNPRLNGAQIEVNGGGGSIQLTGIVRSAAQKALAEQVARDTVPPGTVVEDRLSIGASHR